MEMRDGAVMNVDMQGRMKPISSELGRAGDANDSDLGS